MAECNLNRSNLQQRFYKNGSGFTLLELLVVLLLIGIIMSLAVLSVSTTDNKVVEREAKRFAALVQLAGEHAILESSQVALEVTEKGYQFISLQKDAWLPIEEDELLAPREMSRLVELEFTIDGDILDLRDEDAEIDDEDLKPRIYILSSGEMTPFEATFRLVESTLVYQVTGNPIGELSFDGPLEIP